MEAIALRRARRIVVIGPTDVGKSSFIRLLGARTKLDLIDLDPGQKMIGAPGTVGRGPFDPDGIGHLDRFRWVGSTSAAAVGRIVRAGGLLAAASGFVANTAGYVAGPGARLQAATIAALEADLVVAIGLDQPPLPPRWTGPVLRLERASLARRKSAALRARLRQQAFEQSLGRGTHRLPAASLAFEPAPPAAFEGEVRPVCALAGADGEDMAIAILLSAGEAGAVVQSGPLLRPVTILRLGRMWAAPAETGWRLLERQAPSWAL